MKIALTLLPLVLLHSSLPGQTSPETESQFKSSVTTTQKPWTDKTFKNDPDNFQFAIVTDRTGGMRPGVFPRAVAKVNELQPEFVITVGDLIAGGKRQTDEKEINRQWDEFNGFVDEFEMPFFYLPGNHDVSNPVMDRIWDEMYGARYYSFVYKNVLFLCLNTQDGESHLPSLGDEQVAWASEEIAAHPDVRWTMVFIHQPIWLREEGFTQMVNGEPVLRKSRTGWTEIAAALSGRKHTVYAGHVHRYAKYERNEANYYTLGTTGGGSALRGSSFGEFDHATWITMTDEGPRMMNLTLDGMLADDVTTEAKQKFWRGLKFTENYRETFPFENKVLTLPISNPLETHLVGQLHWILPVTDHWTVEPRRVAIDLGPGEKTEVQFQINYSGDLSYYFPLPRLDSHFHSVESGYHLERGIYLPLDLTEHVKKYPEKTQLSFTTTPPVIDGKLDESVVAEKPTITRLIPRQADGYSPVSTKAWLSYDDTSVYVSIRCEEPILRNVISEAQKRDGEVLQDDSIEILFDTNRDQKSFRHFAVNPDGILFDARESNTGWNSSAAVATAIEENAWTVEMSIPLEDLEADPASYKTWGFQMARHRPRMGEKKSYQWSPTFWYGNTLPSFFGRLNLK